MGIIARKKAKEKGHRFYYTGKFCKNGHVAKRRTDNGACCRCSNEWWNTPKGKVVFDRYHKSEKRKATRREYLQSERGHALAVLCSADRYARKVQSTPKWANKEKMLDFYEVAALMTRVTGEYHQVDHVIPIRSEIVCGLHCEDNFQVITADDNRKKGNTFVD